MATIFSKIISGDIPSHKVAENEEFLAFLDINPQVKGHTLVIPKKEVDYIFDIEDDMLARLHLFAKKVAKGLEKAVPCQRIGVAVVGLEVPHAHIHLMPMKSMSDFGFGKNKIEMSDQEFQDLAESISKKI